MIQRLPSLKRAVLAGSSWTLLSVGAGQLIRLGKSLILTRMLFPEAYGVMAIVWSVLYTLGMLSDAGLAAAAIRHERAHEAGFMNTLWTAKVLRGFAIFVVTCLIAYPLAAAYKMPDLAWLIPLAGLTMVINGFNSTNVYSQQRQMVYGRLTFIELSNEVLGLFVMVIWAYFRPGVEAMIGASIVSALYFLICSHRVLPGIKNSFAWDAAAVRDIFHFGKWVFLSSAIFLVYTQGDRMLLGQYLDVKLLGVYSIAIMISEIVSGVISKLNNAVLYPALSRVISQDRHRLQEVFYKTRLGFDLILVFPIAVFSMVASDAIALMYDSRYHAAGWMLQILCVRLFMVAILSTSEACLFALGKPKYSVMQNVCRAAWILIGIPVAWHSYGIVGVVWVVATTELPVFAVLWYGMAKEKLLSPLLESRSALALLVGAVVGLGLKELFH
nr:oligosaccharide flippase family protein [uncultured Rhodoferax sp.]